MKILILHRVPFFVLQYDQLIDHAVHEVVYLGVSERIGDIPAGLRCTRVALDDGLDHVEHVTRHADDFRGIDRVVSASQYTLRSAARIRELLDCPGMRTAAFDAVDDKVVMKAHIRRQGLRAPAFMPYADFLAADEVPWHGRTVLKPRAETASRNVSVHAGPQALRAAAAAADVPERLEASMQVEEFVEGEILHFDGLVRDGEVVLIQPSRYYGTCLDYAQGAPLGSLQFDCEGSSALAASYVRAAGIENGAFHLEMIEAEDGLCFLEIAPRVGGGGINDAMRLKWGIDLVAADITAQAGMPVPAFAKTQAADNFGFYLVPGHKHAGFRCRARVRSTDGIVTQTAIEPDTVLNADITHNAGEVPLYLILKQDPACQADEFIAAVGRSIDLHYSKE